MEKQKKYYHIRVSLFWMIIAIVVIVTSVLSINILHRVEAGKDTETEEYIEKEYMEYGHIDSKLKNPDECYLCGNADSSLMGYYRKFDTVGIIGLNDWYVLDLRLKNYDEKGNVDDDQSGSSFSHGNSQGVSFFIDATPSRGMTHAKVSSTDGMFDKKVIQNNLCQECLDKVTDTLEGDFEKGKEEYLPFCLVDFKTLDVYSMQRMDSSFTVRDYWVELSSNESELEVDVYYLPERD